MKKKKVAKKKKSVIIRVKKPKFDILDDGWRN